jgi:Ser/Thr protein kinase RdoA (MazF antagonist)
VARAVGVGAELAVIEAASSTLPPVGERLAAGQSRATLVHGDFHLGQIVHLDGALRLIDVDDVGFDDPAWDLARPAAWFTVGVLAPEAWSALVAAYVAEGGPALPSADDLWARLEPFARALTIQTAAQAVVNAHRESRPLDEVELLFVRACERMVG